MAKAGKRKEMVEERTVKNRMSLRCVLHVVSEIVGVRESYVCVCVTMLCVTELPVTMLRVKEFT